MDQDSEPFLQDLKRAISCDNKYEWKLAIHLVWKSEHCEDSNFDKITPSRVDCKEARRNVKNANQDLTLGYPINMLRNIARQGSHTDFQLLSDMENFVSVGAGNVIRNALHKVHRNGKKNTVIIVR